MKKFSFSIFNTVAIFLIVLFIFFAVSPFNLVDMKQAQRIALWKSEFDEYKYCFSLVDIYEGAITDGILDDEQVMLKKIIPYFTLENDELKEYKNYRYTYKNSRPLSKNSQFYFNKFVKSQNGALISFKKNESFAENLPEYFMFVDLNGETKPNKTGEDIFFISIFKHEIQALGYDKDYIKLKQNCSTIGTGIYCSEFYLL